MSDHGTIPLWQPDVALRECIESDVDFACRLHRAMFPLLQRWHNSGRSTSEFEADGIAAHQIAFGLKKPISDRYWRKLWKMVSDRDAGAGNVERLEIYLPRKQTARLTAANVSEALDENFYGLSAAVNGCDDPLHPNLAEQETIERRVREAIDDLVACGRTRKAAMRKVCGVLATLPPYLGKTRHPLRMMVTRWAKKPADSFGDGRRQNTGNHDNYRFSGADWDLFVLRAVWGHDGDVGAAWRELWHTARFTPATMEHFARANRRKGDVPASVMPSVGWWVRILNKWRRGRKGYNSERAMMNVLHCPVPPLLVITADDVTLDCRYGVEVLPGKDQMVRGQCLLFVDFGTMRILGWVLTPAPNYNALLILGELTRIFKRYGVPAGLAFEKGIWENTALLKGRKPAMSATAREGGLERLGIRFNHSLSPQGKARMERVCGLIQKRLAGERGWTGSDEKKTCPEETQRLFARVNRGELRATEAGFRDLEGFNIRLGEIITAYNAEKQEGDVLVNLSPDQTFGEFFSPDYLPTKFTPELEYLLSHHVEYCQVTINGVRPSSKGPHYGKMELRHLLSQQVKVWCKIEEWSESGELDSVIVTDLKNENAIAANRETSVHPAMWLLDPDGDALRRGRRENASIEEPVKELLKRLRPRFTVVEPPIELPTRSTIGSADVHATGKAIAEKSTKQKPGKRGGNVDRLRDVLQQMDSDDPVETGKRIEVTHNRAREMRERRNRRNGIYSIPAAEDPILREIELPEIQ